MASIIPASMPGKYAGHFVTECQEDSVAQFLRTPLPANTLREVDLEVVELSIAGIEARLRRLVDASNTPNVIRM